MNSVKYLKHNWWCIAGWKNYFVLFINCLIFERTKYQNVYFFFGQVIKRTILTDFQKPCGLIKLWKQKNDILITIWGLLQLFSHFTVITDKKPILGFGPTLKTLNLIYVQSRRVVVDDRLFP